MVKTESFDQLLEQIDSIKTKSKNFCTNFYHSRKKTELWITYGLLQYLTIDDTLFILKDCESFHSLFFCSTDISQLHKALITLRIEFQVKTLVVDIVGNKDTVGKFEYVFLENSFVNYTSLRRMSRYLPAKEPEFASDIRYAVNEDSIQILHLLKQYFDPYSEQIPLIEEICEWVDLKHVLIFKEDDRIIGFLIFDLTGFTSYLRYWFTHPDHRDKKIGSRLLRKYFIESNSAKRQQFWVIEDNDNAIKRYCHYGFESENMYDKVLISH